MEKLNIALISLAIICIQLGYSYDHVNAQGLGSRHCLGKEQITKLRFFVQDVVGGDRPTVWKVAEIANLSSNLPSAFGQVNILDDQITSGIEIESKEIGRLQGAVFFSDINEMAPAVLLNIVFTEGKYNGSTLSIVGRNPLQEEVREVPVVGGTGIFRLARGYAFTSSVYSGDTRGVIQYDVVVYHFKDAISSVRSESIRRG